MAGVILKNLTKTFNKVTAVNSINLEILDKEFMPGIHGFFAG